MVSAINFKQMPLISVFKGCDVVSGLAYFLLINLSSQSQIDDILFAGDDTYLNSFCFKKKRFIYLFLAALGLPCCAWTSFSVALHGALIAWCLLPQRQALGAPASVVVVCGL